MPADPTVHEVLGAPGSIEHEATSRSYYAAIACSDALDTADLAGVPVAGTTVRHRLRPDVGDGTIEVTRLRGGFEVTRYDVAFRAGHDLGFTLPGDYFELEYCLEGAMRVSESASGTGDLVAGAAALSPRCPTTGLLSHRPDARYRAVSISGTWSGLARYAGLTGDVGGTSPVAREQYLRGAAGLRAVATPMTEVFLHRRRSPGRVLFLESRLAAAIAILLDASDAPPPDHEGPSLADHEVSAVRRVPDLLWERRDDPPDAVALAGELSMSVRRLTRGFRSVFGATIREHHRRRCLDTASTLLTETDWTVERIAHEVGYASPSGFVFAFRRDRGTTPAQFRRQHA